MKYKLYEHRYTYSGNFAYAADCIRHSLDMLGWEQTTDEADLHIYNHTCRDIEPDMPENSIIFKPTAPTCQHFQICRQGYANSSEITFEEPLEYEFRNYDIHEQRYVDDLIQRRANKWDDSIMLKWKEVKSLKSGHILVIGQMPRDETTHGFGFGDHWMKMKMIIDKLTFHKYDNVVIKLHPRLQKESHIVKDIPQQIEKWEAAGHQVLRGYESIHAVLPQTVVAITENSTAGIECMMHDVPIISYGYPDYHWITKDLRSLTELKNSIDNLKWFEIEDSRKFLYWYIFDYLCYDIPSTTKRLQELL